MDIIFKHYVIDTLIPKLLNTPLFKKKKTCIFLKSHLLNFCGIHNTQCNKVSKYNNDLYLIVIFYSPNECERNPAGFLPVFKDNINCSEVFKLATLSNSYAHWESKNTSVTITQIQLPHFKQGLDLVKKKKIIYLM